MIRPTSPTVKNAGEVMASLRRSLPRCSDETHAIIVPTSCTDGIGRIIHRVSLVDQATSPISGADT